MNALVIADRTPDPSLQEIEPVHDVVITLGDLDIRQLRGLERWAVPKVGVAGNHDRQPYMDEYGIHNLHMSTWEWGGATWGGFEGGNRYKSVGEYQYTQGEASWMLQHLPPVDVLVCHSPPFGVNDHEDEAHVGFHGLRSYCDRHRSRYLLHGHTYPDPPVTEYGETRIVYVSGAETISLDLG